ncbi:hypothetical protein DFA_07695 [Cavenderia fasciculata]|uniref:Uncharacterized protein n=1 Tax=Cavenderia fasciculata TaxID=261658 RepID=F4Q2U1_CACFS|nr:uncharacterized protein DFA_07695 [Cavenderia fasciculata]EGG16717.1 hypothetical protein DFA_07695 [Cavenderia fasciculata]|eukprot:XP_004355191.1 hypothetical protein DFA_07695 [Cavenderia fasciculata]
MILCLLYLMSLIYRHHPMFFLLYLPCNAWSSFVLAYHPIPLEFKMKDDKALDVGYILATLQKFGLVDLGYAYIH